MLLAQSAVTEHSIDHVWNDTPEYCQAYISAEASKLLVSSDLTLDVGYLPHATHLTSFLQATHHQRAITYARGPPITV